MSQAASLAPPAFTRPPPFPFLAGPLALAGDGLVPPSPDAPALPLTELLAPGAVERILAPLLRDRPGQDRRALLSLWSRHYFFTLIPPVVLTLSLAHRSLPLAVEEAGLLLKPDGLPGAIVLPHEGTPCPPPEAPFARFAPLLRAHLAPLIAHWAAEARLSPRVLWANAATYFAWIVREMGQADALPPGAAAAGEAILAAPRTPEAEPNPMHEPTRLIDGPEGPQRWRKVCCLLYLLPGRDECSYCPLLLGKDRKGRD
ncbi:siderophore-iron reductase FhuF [Roseomonas sp. GC11]|uniref:siderophore-iron reductase FhuF n=1 Tax=Roseomonas sp. GC11 TaxID=2950546 RepID=UPI00210C5486|nr:siderophore-iron reductase FhuF [Roseomonas sp. GC11]MCQ4162520.1 siderophore-iron reductase FhuF [Roseomonas sp. GC11]